MSIGWIPTTLGFAGILINGYQIVMINKYRHDKDSFWYLWDNAAHWALGIPYCLIGMIVGIAILAQ